MKYLKTEIVRHSVTGGAFSDDGVLRASKNVLDGALRFSSLRDLLGTKKEEVKEGHSSLLDYEILNGQRRQRKEKPVHEHVLLGVPDIPLNTCNRIFTKNGPVYRHGGMYIKEDDRIQSGILVQIYKSSITTYAIVEVLVDRSHEYNDCFLTEAGMKVWRRSGRFKIISKLSLVESLPLFHACKFELPPASKCEFVFGVVPVMEERQLLRRMRMGINVVG